MEKKQEYNVDPTPMPASVAMLMVLTLQFFVYTVLVVGIEMRRNTIFRKMQKKSSLCYNHMQRLKESIQEIAHIEVLGSLQGN